MLKVENGMYFSGTQLGEVSPYGFRSTNSTTPEVDRLVQAFDETRDLDDASSINPSGIRAGTQEELTQMRQKIIRNITRKVFAQVNG